MSAANDETEQLHQTLLKVTQQNEHLLEERAAMEGDMETILKQRAELQQQVAEDPPSYLPPSPIDHLDIG